MCLFLANLYDFLLYDTTSGPKQDHEYSLALTIWNEFENPDIYAVAKYSVALSTQYTQGNWNAVFAI